MNIRQFPTRAFPVLLLAFSFIALPASSQLLDYPTPGFKSWNDSPLTWQDFQVRHLPAGTKTVSLLSVTSRSETEIMIIGNTKFPYVRINAYMDRLLSWYDPDKSDEWQLRYNQVVFDMAQLYALKYQNEYNSRYSRSPSVDHDYYNRLFASKYEAIQMESDNGRDSSVIKRYETEVREELERMELIEPSIPVEGDTICGLGCFAGYEMQIPLGMASKNFGPFSGINLTFDFSMKDWFIDFLIGIGTCSELKTTGFYHDPEYDYDWRKGQPTNHFHVGLNLGRQICSTRHYRFIPYIGAGLAGFDQNTEIPFNNSPNSKRFETSETTGFRLQAGIKADWKFRHIIEEYSPSDCILRMEIFGGYDHFSTVGDFWTANMAITIGFDGYFIK